MIFFLVDRFARWGRSEFFFFFEIFVSIGEAFCIIFFFALLCVFAEKSFGIAGILLITSANSIESLAILVPEKIDVMS